MIVMVTEIKVAGISGKDLIDFMLNCSTEDYRKWWPGTHIAFHTSRRYPDNLGNCVYFDEYVGKRRLKFKGIVTEIVPGKRLTWQMKKLIKLPGWLTLDIKEDSNGVMITHTLAVGWQGSGRILDLLLRIFLSKKFAKDLEEHAHEEFSRLADILSYT